MQITRAELAQLGARPGIRRFPRFAPKPDRPRHRDPSMAPTRGLTPANTVPGPKAYVYFAPTRVAIATWHDARDRVPVTWITYERWRATRWPDHDRAPGRAS